MSTQLELFQDVTQNWPEVEERLQALEHAYKSIGPAGNFVREVILAPLKQRYDSGERTRELAEDVMAVAL